MPIKKTTRDELLIKSAQAFREKGFFNTSISDLSKVCGVRNANFYYYFKDKEHLMEEILKYVHEYFLTGAIKIAYDESLTPQQRIEKMMHKLENLFLHSEGGCIMGNTALESALVNPTFMEIVRSYFKDWIEALTHLYKFKYGEVVAREVAETTVQDVEGGIMLYKVYKDKSYILKALQRAVKRFENPL